MINESFSLHSSHLYFASRATYTLNYFVWLFYESSGFCFLMQHRLPLRRSLSWFFIEIVKLNYSSEKRDAQQTNEIAFNSWNLWTLSNDIIAISTSHKHKSLMWRCKDSLTVYQTSFARVSHSFISFCYSFNSMTYILRSGFTSEEIHFMILWPFQTILSLDRGLLREELRKRCWYRLKLMVIAIDHFDMIFKHIISSYLLIVDRMEMIFKSLREC